MNKTTIKYLKIGDYFKTVDDRMFKILRKEMDYVTNEEAIYVMSVKEYLDWEILWYVDDPEEVIKLNSKIISLLYE